MPRYVILEHDHPTRHWDLMLEADGALRTWRLAAWPQDGMRIRALPIGDHRLAYLDYEGPVSGDRGRVQRRDEGTYAGLVAPPLCVTMSGTCLKGTVTISADAAGTWWFRYVSGTSWQKRA
jgi:DNA polymerase Ligase (LigD)